MTLIGTSAAEHTLHDSTEVAANQGFIPDADGSFEGKLRNDTSVRTFNVLGGHFYPLDIKLAQDTGKVGVAQLLIVNSSRA